MDGQVAMQKDRWMDVHADTASRGHMARAQAGLAGQVAWALAMDEQRRVCGASPDTPKLQHPRPSPHLYTARFCPPCDCARSRARLTLLSCLAVLIIPLVDKDHGGVVCVILVSDRGLWGHGGSHGQGEKGWAAPGSLREGACTLVLTGPGRSWTSQSPFRSDPTENIWPVADVKTCLLVH